MNELYRAVIVSGIAVGGGYALVAVGITQTFVVTRVLNFAQAGFALWGAYLYATFTVDEGWPVGVAAVVTLLIIAAMGALAELLVFRFASRATLVNKSILTFGLFLFLTAMAANIWTSQAEGATPLMPSGGFELLGATVSWQQLTNLVVVVLVVAGTSVFLRFTRLGLLTRAMAEDRTITELLGVSKNTIGIMNWTYAAVLGGMAGILTASLQPFQIFTFFQYFLLGLVATLVGGMRSLWLTALGGIAVGVILGVSQIASSEIGAGTLWIFVGVVVLVLLRRSWPSELSIGWTRPQLPDGSRVWLGARIVLVAGWVWLLVAVNGSDLWGLTGALILVYTVAVLSVVPLTGWGGHITLAQGGFMGVGAYTLGEAYAYHQLPMAVALLIVVVVCAVVGGLIGVLTARLPFVQTAVVTASFTGAASAWLFYKDWFHVPGQALTVLPPGYLDTGRSLFAGFVVVTVVAVVVLRNLRNSQWGIKLISVRSAPDMVRHFGVSATASRVSSYAVSGATAGIAGAMLVMLLTIAGPQSFGIGLSLSVLLYAVAGGVTSLVGAFVGPLLFIGLPQALQISDAGSTVWSDIIGGALIIVLLASRADGLLSILRKPSNESTTFSLRKTVNSLTVRGRREVPVAALSVEVADEHATTTIG